MREVFGGERWATLSGAIVVESQPQGKQSLAAFTRACDGFDPLGCIAAGKALRATKQPADAERARVYFERACAAGVDDGCTAIAKPAAGPAPIARAHGCGCSGEVAPGTHGGLALLVLALLRRRRRTGTVST